MPTAARPRRRKMLRMRGRPGAVVGAADRPLRAAAGSRRPGCLASASAGRRGRVRGRIGVGSSSGVASSSSASSRAVRVAGRRRRRRPRRRAADRRASSGPGRGARPSALARRRSSSRMNSSNRSPIDTAFWGSLRQQAGRRPAQRRTEWAIRRPGAAGRRYGRWRDSTDLAEAREDLLGELVRGERRDERRLEPERGPDRQRAAPRSRVVLGRDERREADREPAVLLEDQPGQRARERRAPGAGAAAPGAGRRTDRRRGTRRRPRHRSPT